MLASLAAVIQARSSGAPSGACSTFMPRHPGDPEEQSDPTPFVVGLGNFPEDSSDMDDDESRRFFVPGASYTSMSIIARNGAW